MSTRPVTFTAATADSYAGKLATIQETATVTAILEAGRRSLDIGGAIEINYDDKHFPCELSFVSKGNSQ